MVLDAFGSGSMTKGRCRGGRYGPAGIDLVSRQEVGLGSKDLAFDLDFTSCSALSSRQFELVSSLLTSQRDVWGLW